MNAGMRTLVAGGVVAAAIAALLVAVTAGGENGWKFALAAVGLVLWILGGISKNPDPTVPSSGQNGRK
jgi:peptidoglycan/LPS O-acetylase OafA/YrhL